MTATKASDWLIHNLGTVKENIVRWRGLEPRALNKNIRCCLYYICYINSKSQIALKVDPK